MTTPLVRNIWLEHYTPTTPTSIQGADQGISLSLGRAWYKIPKRIVATGLSPDCSIAFIATDTHVRLYALDLDTPSTPGEVYTVLIDCIEDAAVSDSHLVVLTKSKTRIFQYQRSLKSLSVAWLVDEPHTAAIWTPICIAICECRWGTRIVIGGDGVGPEVRLLHLRRTDSKVTLATLHTYTHNAIDTIKTINFCPNGEVIAAVMADSSRVLIWHVRQNGGGVIVPTQPVDILASGNTSNGRGISSASVFRSPASQRKYVFCTVDRAPQSQQRSQLAPLAPNGVGIPHARANQNDMTIPTIGYAEPVVVGTVSLDGRYLAVVEREGEIRLFRTAMHPNGGLTSQEVVSAANGLGRLCRQLSASPTSIRILDGVAQAMTYQFRIVAIDRKGSVIVRTYV